MVKKLKGNGMAENIWSTLLSSHLSPMTTAEEGNPFWGPGGMRRHLSPRERIATMHVVMCSGIFSLGNVKYAYKVSTINLTGNYGTSLLEDLTRYWCWHCITLLWRNRRLCSMLYCTHYKFFVKLLSVWVKWYFQITAKSDYCRVKKNLTTVFIFKYFNTRYVLV